MNVYDFDNTIYDGESVVDFYMFCLKRDIRLIKYLPILTEKIIKYKLCIITSEELIHCVEKYAKKLIEEFNDFDFILECFWNKNLKKIKPFYIKQKSDDDIILSASFDFILKIPAEKLNLKNVISSKMDLDTGKISRLCFSEMKIPLLNEYFGGSKKERICFYTDSMNDKPMIEYADEAYLVKGNRIQKIK